MLEYGALTPEMVEEIREAPTRPYVEDFIVNFANRVLDEQTRPPDCWIQFAAELLYSALEASKSAKNQDRLIAIMKALHLEGRSDDAQRNLHIYAAIQLLNEAGESQRGAAAQLAVELEDSGVDVSEDTLLTIYKQTPEEARTAYIAQMAEDFSRIGLGLQDVKMVILNYKQIAKYFNSSLG